MNNNQLQNLLKIASARLGTSPEALMQAAQNGQMANIIGKGEQSDMISKVLSDPQAAQKLLSSDKAQELMKMLSQK